MKLRIAVTAGDPCGIGPEIVRKAVGDPRVQAVCEPVLYGPPPGIHFPIGQVSEQAGRAAYEAVCAAVGDVRAGKAAALATAPVSKLAFSRAGLPWKGHTDLLQHLTDSPRVAMMFWSDPLKVVLLTIHVPLASVPALLTRELVEDTIHLAARELARFAIASPRLAVAGLNPHAGEEGLFGEEERHVLRPSVEAARSRGIDVDGPFPSDTVFGRAVRGEFDAVIACYHDQGLIPVKLLAFGRAVNVTLGLPFVRTSVDHGTAFDIAGRDVADPGSMIEAILLAARLAAA
jgi:4-hydroxythreonine-4-phosphate dehydrogenase